MQELKLQTGDLSDLRYRPKGSVALQGTAWLPTLTPDIKRTNKIPECPGFGWDRVNFVFSSWYSAVFWI